MADPIIYTRTYSPYRVDFLVDATADFDPTDASAWTCEVTHPDGTVAEWSLSVQSVTVEQARLRHTHSVSGAFDVPVIGYYSIHIKANTPAGVIHMHTKRIRAVEK